MLKFHFLQGHVNESGKKIKGLPPWIYEELKAIAEVAYRFADEEDVTDTVEQVAENMAPWYNLPEERILDGDSLLFGTEVDNEAVKSLLFDYFTPDNMRVDLMSSLFGRDAEYNDLGIQDEEEKKEETVEDEVGIQPIDDGIDKDDEANQLFDKEKAGPSSIEPRFGTKFWVEPISEDMIRQWSTAANPQLPSPEWAIGLPPKNTFIPTKFDLKPLPPDDADPDPPEPIVTV